MNPSIIAGIVSPVVTAILAGVGIILERRNLEHRRKDFLSQANQQIAFFEVWLRLHEQIGDDEKKRMAHAHVEHEIMRLYQNVSLTVSHDVDKDLSPGAGKGKRVTFTTIARGVFSLNSPPPTTLGVLLRIAYYPTLFASIAVFVGSIATVVQNLTIADVLTGITVITLFAMAPVGSIRIVDYWVADRARRK